MSSKLYQVFVSSPSRFLQPERREVVDALLENHCVPTAMEHFPSADDKQWSLIKEKIDECDYFVVLVGGSCGTIASTGRSYTFMEYEYASKQKKPILGFLENPPSSDEADPERARQVKELRDLIARKAHRVWNKPSELRNAVGTSVREAIERTPTTGWMRADAVPATFCRDNNHVAAELSAHIRRGGVREAHLVQYSGRNVLSLLQALWRHTDAKIHLHVKDPGSQDVVGPQPERIRRFASELPRDLAETDTGAVLRYFQYDPPGAPRLVLLDDDVLAFGSFLYQARDPDDKTTLDVWGGEVPVMLLRKGHPDFSNVHKMATELLKNWRTSRLTRFQWEMDNAERRRRASAVSRVTEE